MANISTEKTYMVFNNTSSPLCISTRFESFMLQGRDSDTDSGIPLTLDDIKFINVKSPIFKIGLAGFEPEDAPMLYKELRINHWEDILSDGDIEDILLNPTGDKLQRIIDIDSLMYFERVRGLFISLENRGAHMTMQVQNVIKMRYTELQRKKTTSDLKVVMKEDRQRDEEMDDLKRRLAEMEELLRAATATAVPSEDETPKKSRKRSTPKKEEDVIIQDQTEDNFTTQES